MAKKKRPPSSKKPPAVAPRRESPAAKGRSEPTRRKAAQKSPSSQETNDSPDAFPIIGVGASAGGLKALKEFLDAFPENPGVAVVIVQHLDPTRKSLGPELLAPHTSM